MFGYYLDMWGADEEVTMLARVLAPAHLGLTSTIISVECDISNGLPNFLVVGLGDKAVDEAKERVRSALRHAGLFMPPKRITLNLAPADLPKDGTGFDLGIAVALLVATGQVKADLGGKLFAGELGLDGSVRPIKATLSHAQAVRSNKLKELYIPAANAPEAALCRDITIYAVESLKQLYLHLIGEDPLTPFRNTATLSSGVKPTPLVDFAQVQGQARSKRALEIAAAGGHNILMSGPPGAGKTMLARALAGVLPPLTFEELVEVNQIHSVAGLTTQSLVTERPFRNPHHTASGVSLIGGGRSPKPGEISLAHRGVLFMDELPEFPRSVLEVLRQPLEDGQVSVSRASGSVIYPARFMLVATQNPCPCGFAGDPDRNCSCTAVQISRYTKRVSGPLLDRIDICIEVSAVKSQELTSAKPGETSASIAGRIAMARLQQAKRFKDPFRTNAEMTNKQLTRWCTLEPAVTRLAEQAITNLRLSARGYMRLLRVARTIADLAGVSEIAAEHFTEALQYRARALD